MNKSITQGTIKDPLPETVIGLLGHIIVPEDEVVTFTQTHRSGTRICLGIYKGVIKEYNGFGNVEIYYIVQRSGRKRTKLYYNHIVHAGTTLEDLNGMIV